MGTRIVGWAVIAMLATACNGSPGTPKPGATKPAAPTAQPTAAPASATDRTITGTVLGLDGKPAADVQVQAYIISNNGGSLIAPNGGTLIAPNGGTLISPNGGTLVPKLKYALAQAGLTAKTDAQGHFRLSIPGTDPVNLEAVQSKNVKAALLAVSPTQTDVSMALAATGGIKGQVKSRIAGVTNLEGVDVFIPGLPYSVKADAGGNFALVDVPAAKAGLAYTLVASKTGLGRGEAKVTVYPEAFAQVTALDLTPEPATIADLVPSYGKSSAGNALLAPGKLTIKGQNFGATRGAPFQVFAAGKELALPKRVDDQTIEVTLPADVGSGPIGVTVDGTAGTTRPFAVLTGLEIKRASGEAATGLFVGDTQPLAVVGLDAHGERTPLANVAITVAGAAASVDAQGVVTAKAAGTATLQAAIGTLQAKLDLEVQAASLTRHTLASRAAGDDLAWITGIADGKGGLYLLEGDLSDAAKPKRLALVQLSAGGALTRVAALPDAGSFRLSLALDPQGNVVVQQGDHFLRVTPAGQVAVLPGSDGEQAANGSVDSTVAVDGAGLAYYFDDVFIQPGSDPAQPDLAGKVNRLLQLDAAGKLTPVLRSAKGEFTGGPMLVQGRTLYWGDGQAQALMRLDLANAAAGPQRVAGKGGAIATNVDGDATTATFTEFTGLALDPQGALWVLSGPNLRAVNAAGAVTTVVKPDTAVRDEDGGKPVPGLGETGGTPQDAPKAIAFDAEGRCLVVTPRRIYRLKLR